MDGIDMGLALTVLGGELDSVELAAGVPFAFIIVHLVKIAREAGLVESKMRGVLSVGIGLVLGAVRAAFGGGDPFESLILGLFLGLVAAGGFSTAKNAREALTDHEARG